ncbi:glucose dehydrogenase [Acinetobacter sp. ANC 5054]|uniref:PQQ-dependent sugar dehydrogenase n=1 Tax=Acinetobacter sp. ANC 5054 TaxID=1977877 RepID=UPI000A35A953|nr:PQQ-dependent sugar dehydrogenase [Acinetobacter sp. ANC 5054]OTG84618.1 glucose dehydrogenase [Acinetobacter sp. ANC 5054]
MSKINVSLRTTAILIGILGSTACQSESPPAKQEQSAASHSNLNTEQTFKIHKIAQFNEPWAIQQLPDGRLILTERKGQLVIFDPKTQQKTQVGQLPKVAYGGQGGLGDIVLDPAFASNQHIYLSYAEAGQGGYGAVIEQAKLNVQDAKPRLQQRKIIWKQTPKVDGQGHYSHRMQFGPDGKLWVSSGERQKFDPAQDMQSNLGKVLRLNTDGSPAADNPFQSQGQVAQQVWSLGHRNPLGMAFDAKQQLWVAEMGPKGGDELNLVLRGKNYGYPHVSNGDHYDGKPIPDHHTRPEFEAPAISWTPVISPSSLMFYQGQKFPAWKNKALIGGLSSQAIVVVDTEAKPAIEIQRIAMPQRIRGLIQAQDGSIWGIEDGEKAWLFQIQPK